ncbi:hypothetical protein V8C42DRAFT_356531 [Trichoderma barbatum]
MEDIQALKLWAEKKAILEKDVDLVNLSGRGVGVITKRKIKKGQTILNFPMGSIRSLHTVPKGIVQKLPNVSLRGLLAADLAVDQSSDLAPWRTVLPPLESLKAATPFMWHEDLQSLLTKASKDILYKQQLKFAEDWKLVSEAFQKLPREEYAYAWLINNFFNHADEGCKMEFTEHEYTLLTDREYEAGQEIYFSYGKHSNGLLLTEYGFVLMENRWDTFSMDITLSELSELQRAELQKPGCLGPFKLSVGNVESWRGTEVTPSLLCHPQEGWKNTTRLKGDGALSIQREIDTKIMQMLGDFLKAINRDATPDHYACYTLRKMLEEIETTQIGQETQRCLLIQRWEQIRIMALDIKKGATHTIQT